MADSMLTDHLQAARRGDQRAFGALTEPYRHELQVHCYRILGSLQEAEDLVQETLLKAWRRLDTYEGRASIRAWLYKIATNACLDALDRRRARRRLPQGSQPIADPQAPIIPPVLDPVWLEPYPDDLLPKSGPNPEARYAAAESVSLAFMAALQTLPPRQRAVLILRDVLDWPAREVADLIGCTVSAANSALHRARVTLSEHYPAGAPDQIDASPADEQTRQLLDRYVQAWQAADVAGLVALLKHDATFSMPPSPSWFRGADAIGRFVAATVFADQGMFAPPAAGRWRLYPTAANGQPALAMYLRADGGAFVPFAIQVLTIRSGTIAAIDSFNDPTLPPRFAHLRE